MMSMTGFGQGSAARNNLSVRVELSSVNRKNLDITTSLPRTFSALEAHCQTLLQKKLHRGRIQVRLEIKSDLNTPVLTFDEIRAADLLDRANRFAHTHHLRPIDSVSDLMRYAIASPNEEPEIDSEVLKDLLEVALTNALDELITMRAREGAHLSGVLTDQLKQLENILHHVEPLIDTARKDMIRKLEESVQALDVDLKEAQPRLLQEIALYAERTDIREETDRIQGHIKQAREKINTEGPCGRALDFLCQELGRELNTLSVKAASTEINRFALAGKEQLEMIREQVQNVE